MHRYLFEHIDIPKENINIPDCTISQDEVEKYCATYDKKIESYGGLDFQLLGIGRTGHIGFNEPGSNVNSATRLIRLNSLTRLDAACDFNGLKNVPSLAITMGVETILNAKRIVLLGWGHKKAPIIKHTVEGEIEASIPASYLQTHPNATLVLDQEAACEITRFATPWRVMQCIWTEELKRKAIIWLSERVQKPILKLTDGDYNENGLSDLIAKGGSAYNLNIEMFNILQHTITGWPGGKPNADDSKRPERALPAKKRVIIFSPHPDDDVISMGGTFARLVEQGHEVNVAYQTSGNIAVSDEEVFKFCEVGMGIGDEKHALFDKIIKSLKQKKGSDTDIPEVRKMKSIIRQKESLASVRSIGLEDSNTHFLSMPFYETGEIKKKPIGERDINIVVDLIKKIKPHQIYAAGDLADPHGTHKVCLEAIFKALELLKKETFINDCYVWLYRGAWHEWGIYEIDMAVPMSPEQVLKKREAILFHQSQKDKVMFQGEDSREFWMRAEQRNKTTAELYNRLGMAEYEAIEAFKRYYF
ncbi:glucosamine-6-phosphate deaminase [Elysia marginata]|uniref:Glucosamine-6-phosphate deaminase n=1 Tax=Elysia marginata TaxID=1093978 RepID=A0AAV4FM41_9GAST|nr:glucosamine-6-phosphate deaminase [Elysia marginata]